MKKQSNVRSHHAFASLASKNQRFSVYQSTSKDRNWYKIAANHYHRRNNNEAYYQTAFKKFLLLLSISFIAVIIFLFFAKSDIKIPRKTISVPIDIKDRINICLPDEQ